MIIQLALVNVVFYYLYLWKLKIVILLQITGIQLEGCYFDGTQLQENQRDSLSVIATPPCLVAWVPRETPPPYQPKECVSLPLYFSSDRYKLVTCLEVPGRGGSKNSQWIQSGAALFLKN